MSGASRAPTLRPIAFLDKDGTLVEDVPYSVDAGDIRFMPGAIEALRDLCQAGFLLVLCTNQSGVARGFFDDAALRHYLRHLQAMVAEHGVRFDAIVYCPHHPAGIGRHAVACDCRKPAPGLLLRGAARLRGDLARSWMIGDILDDVESGHRAGCRSVLLDNGHETKWHLGGLRNPDAVAVTLPEAVKAILESQAADVMVRRKTAMPTAPDATASARSVGAPKPGFLSARQLEVPR